MPSSRRRTPEGLARSERGWPRHAAHDRLALRVPSARPPRPISTPGIIRERNSPWRTSHRCDWYILSPLPTAWTAWG